MPDDCDHAVSGTSIARNAHLLSATDIVGVMCWRKDSMNCRVDQISGFLRVAIIIVYYIGTNGQTECTSG